MYTIATFGDGEIIHRGIRTHDDLRYNHYTGRFPSLHNNHPCLEQKKHRFTLFLSRIFFSEIAMMLLSLGTIHIEGKAKTTCHEIFRLGSGFPIKSFLESAM